MEHFVSKSDTNEADKDLWETPKPLFDPLNEEFEFTLDACASKDNALCEFYLTAKDDSLTVNWTGYTVFCNPPYSNTQEFILYASSQAKDENVTTVMLVNANTDTKWFAEAASTANEIRLITGRIGFISASGEKANGNTKGQCLIIWRGKCKSACQISMISRDELMK